MVPPEFIRRRQEMKNGIIRALCVVLVAGLTLAVAGCSRKKEPKETQDLESVRARLRAEVARGKLTREEAIVRLAEATREAKLGSGGKGEGKEETKLSPALEALSQQLKERVAKGELTEAEAKTAWIEAVGEAKSGAKATNNAVKEKG
jgi:polyhydroxyalkanoate synthesis regulator phasin